MLWKCCIQYASKFGKLSSGHRTGKVFIPIPKKGNAKECSNYCIIALISHTSKVMLKVLQARLQQCMNWELSDVQVGFRKVRGTRDQIANIRWVIEKAREFQKNMYFCFIDYTKAFDSVDHNRLCKILQEMGIPDHILCLLRNLKKQQLEPAWNNRLVPNWERSYIKAVYCHSAYLTYLQSTSCEMLGWRKHKLESRLPGQYQ